MASYLMKNGEVLSDLLPSSDHPLPTKRELCWQDCTVVTAKRIEARPVDRFAIVLSDNDEGHPFYFSRCRIAVDGWEVEGKVLY